MNANQFCDDMKMVFERLTEIVQNDEYNESKGKEFLTLFFANDKSQFCRFVGFLDAQIKAGDIKKSVAAEVFSEIAMAGVSLGWDDGYASAKRIYRAA